MRTQASQSKPLKLAQSLRRMGVHHWLLGVVFAVGLVFFAQGAWIKVKAGIAQILLNHAFLMSQSAEPGQSPVKPWGWADMGVFARISVPRLGVSDIVLDNVSGEALAFGPGHLPQSARPGEAGTAVFSAHRDTHFRWLKNLRIGDAVQVETADGKHYGFRVVRSWVAPFDRPAIATDAFDSRIALTTCWPFGSTARSKWRYIVEGRKILRHDTKAQTSKTENRLYLFDEPTRL